MDLRKFLGQHGLGQYSEKEDPAERTEDLLIQREGPARTVHCKGCGRVMMDYADAQSQSERNFGMHMKCYREALEKMEELRKKNPER